MELPLLGPPPSPRFDLEPIPELAAPRRPLKCGCRKVLVATPVDAHGSAAAQAEQLGDLVGVEEVVEVHLSAHASRE